MEKSEQVRLKSEQERLILLLEYMEWSKHTPAGDMCPYCGKLHRSKFRLKGNHDEECELYTFLVALRAGVFQVVLRT